MIEKAIRKEWLLRHLLGLLYSFVLGLIGGAVCGAIILLLCGLAGRIQTTGENYLGFWDKWLAVIGAMYGGPSGAIVGPIAYLLVLRTTGFKRAIIPATVGTIVCGFAGSLYTPGLGLPTGIAGFFIALLIVRFVRPAKSSSANTSIAI